MLRQVREKQQLEHENLFRVNKVPHFAKSLT
jgi:hypothetical protein